MSELVPINDTHPDFVADHVKHGYAAVMRCIAEVQYKLAELAHDGKIDDAEDALWALHHLLHDAVEALYHGTLCAVRDYRTDDDTWDHNDNHYSDGSEVITRVTVEPEPVGEHKRPTAGYLLDSGALWEFPVNAVWHVNKQPQPGM